MKKLFILFISLIIASPVLALNLDKKNRFHGGEFVNVEIISSNEDVQIVNYVDYLLGLSSGMKKAWTPPLHLKSSKTVYTFNINPKKQTINHINLIRTSGYTDVDSSAIALLKKEIVFKNLPDESYAEEIALKATFVRSVFGKSDVYNNGTVILMTKNSKKNYAKNIDMTSQKRICKKYVRGITKELNNNFILPDYPAMYMSIFKFDILKDGSVNNIKVTETSSSRKFDEDVKTRLLSTKFAPFPPALLEDKITLEYTISNHLIKPSNK